MRKFLSAAVALGVLSSTSLTPVAFADVAATALPSLNSATNADVTVGTNNNMNIQIQGGQGGLGTLNWNTYNVGKDASVNYEFTAHNQTALNKVSATGGLSQIYGKITASGCSGCGYDATGKVILLNPNGVLFGDGANVNLNSFTVSTFDGTFDKDTNKLQLDRNGKTSQYGIVVQEGATIYGDKAVNFASDNVTVYNGSKISTNVAPNYNKDANGAYTDSFGKVKIVTADCVNFSYYNNGAVKGLSATESANKMVIQLNGDIQSGNIDVRNMSTNVDSQINLKGATLKATKAVSGNDGNIWLTASNKVVIEDSKLETVNYSDSSASRNGGNVQIVGTKKVSIGTTDIDAVGNVDIISQGTDVVVDKTTIDTAKNVNVQAANIASVQNASVINGKNVTVKGGSRGQVVASSITATEDINVSGDDIAWTNNAKLTAGNDINVTASNGYLLLNDSLYNAKNNINLTAKESVTSAHLAGTSFGADKDVNVTSTANSILLTGTSQFAPKGSLNLNAAKNVEINSTDSLTTEKTNITAGENVFLTSANGDVNVKDTTKFLSAKKIYIQGANDVKTTGTVDMNNIQTNIQAGKDVNVTLANVGKYENGLVATAGENMTVTTDGTLSVSHLVSGKDMTINANKVIAGLPYTTATKLPGDASERSYIEVGGEFTSNVTNDNYVITQSGELTDDGQYNKKHHIQYGEEKILLVNKRPVENTATDPNLPGINGGDDVDVVNPGDRPVDPNPSEPTDPVVPENPDDSGNTGDGGNTGDDGNTGDSGNTDSDEGECPDVPTEDVIEEEQNPGLLSVADLAKYTLTAKDKQF